MVCPNCDYRFDDVEEIYEVILSGGRRQEAYICPMCGFGSEFKEDFEE
jgi:rubredoxin